MLKISKSAWRAVIQIDAHTMLNNADQPERDHTWASMRVNINVLLWTQALPCSCWLAICRLSLHYSCLIIKYLHETGPFLQPSPFQYPGSSAFAVYTPYTTSTFKLFTHSLQDTILKAGLRSPGLIINFSSVDGHFTLHAFSPLNSNTF